MKTDKRKNGRRNRRRKYLRLLLVLLLLAVAGGSYSYYALVYRTSTEPQPQRSHTTSEAVYSLESRMKLLHLTPKVREAAFTGPRGGDRLRNVYDSRSETHGNPGIRRERNQ